MRDRVPSTAFSHRSMLVIDQTAAVRRFVSANLARRGYDIHEAADLEQALAQLRDWRPSVIIIEIPFQEYQWQRWLSQTCRICALSGIPMIAFSTQPHTLDELRAANPNILAELVKPFPVESLIATVETVIGSCPVLH